MRRLWTEDVVTHHGDRFHIDDVRLLPKPVQQPLDVWLGGIAPSELRRVGRLADGWLPSFVTPADVRAGLATIREVADAHDREIEAEHFGVLIPYANEPIDEDALELLRGRRPDLNIGEMVARSAQDLAPLIERFVEVGASKFVVVPFAPMTDITADLEELSAVVRPLET
jgi:alkanesulfonate monooxygenase SsuD/methylene tetrahydromethanopterin reductase-like flavin-dependent oxidoreductase (luciferase family)